MSCNRYHPWAALDVHAFSKAEAVLRFSAEEDGIWVQWQDYARLKAEVDMLKANCERMSSDFVEVADEHSALKRQVKQLTLGGDELMEIINGFYCPERGLAHDIWQSAKKGKLP